MYLFCKSLLYSLFCPIRSLCPCGLLFDFDKGENRQREEEGKQKGPSKYKYMGKGGKFNFFLNKKAFNILAYSLAAMQHE